MKTNDLRGGVAFLGLALLLLVGCSYRVTPPLNPAHPTDVLIVDYGYHSSLVMSREEGVWAEWAFGEWEWLAKGNMAWYRGIPALLGSTGTLGMRPMSGEKQDLAVQFPSTARLQPVLVERGAVEKLEKRLEQEFKAGGEPHFNGSIGMSFVRDSERYSIAHHCNIVVAGWLRELGSEVKGSALIADFKIEQPRASAQAR